MKQIAILGALCITVLTLGMAPPNDTSCCGTTCLMPAYMMCLQPEQDSGFGMQGSPDRMRRPKLRSSDNRDQLDSDRKMPKNMVEHVMAVANEIDPDLAAQLAAVCAADPEAFQKIIHRQGRRFGSLIRLREDDPELFEVKVTELKTDAEIYSAAEALRGQDMESPESQAKLAELQGLVRAKTALTLRAQTLYIGRLEKHLDALRKRLDDTSVRFDEIVAQRVDQLLNTVQNVKQAD
ncbi:MAG: hypothetical protein H8E86_06405 [Planctomycetes bacterium]|nr:hypothetical protein [Planctomycetota bacterium]